MRFARQIMWRSSGLSRSAAPVLTAALRWWWARRHGRAISAGGIELEQLEMDPAQAIRLAADARYHGVSTIVRAWCEEHDLLHGVRDLLRERCEGEARRAAAQWRMTDRLHGALISEGIDGIFYRGVTLAARYYDVPAERPAEDLDLLISPTARERVAALLPRLGFQLRGPSSGAESAMEWLHVGEGVALDLHCQVIPIEYGEGPSFAELRARCRTVSRSGEGGELLELSTPDLYLIQAHHGFRHLWARMKWLVDLAVIGERETAEERELRGELVRRFGMEGIVDVGESLAEQLLTGEISPRRKPARQDVKGAIVRTTVIRKWRYTVPLVDRLLNRLIRYSLLGKGRARGEYRRYLVRRAGESMWGSRGGSRTVLGIVGTPFVLIVLLAARGLVGVSSFRVQQRVLRATDGLRERLFRDRLQLSVGPRLCRLFVTAAAAHPRVATCYIAAWCGALVGSCCGYRSRMQFGVAASRDGFQHHAWCELWKDGAWKSMDPASARYRVFEREQSRERGGDTVGPYSADMHGGGKATARAGE